MSQQTVFNGRYEIHRRLARGGMADVYLARDQLLDRPVAVKVLVAEFATDPSFVARFRREAQAAANLNHPNIVGVYDWGEQDSTYFIVMEYVEGRSLAEIIGTEGPLHPDRAADVATDVAAALGFAHRNCVVHRDIKPGNILISPSGQVKVADCGIARAMDAAAEQNLTQTCAVMGTATYFAPEQAQGLPLDPRSDLYALGVVMYEMVTGRPPFAGDSPVAIAYKHVQEQPVPLRNVNGGVPVAFEAVVMKLLAKDPADRHASAEDLRADLRRFRQGEGVLAAGAGIGAATIGATQVAAPVGATQVVPPYQDGPTYVAEERYSYPEPNRSGWFLAVLILLLVVLAGLLFLLARTLGDDGGGDDNEPTVEQVEVPAVTGQTADVATATLEGAGFTVNRVDEENDTAEPGIVFAQEPAAGTEREDGSEVTIRVAQAVTVSMPQVTNQSFDDAEAFLADQGFTDITRVDEFNDDVAAGTVFAQDPAPGADVPLDVPITLTTSQGAQPVAIENVAGRTVGEASNTLGRQGFNVDQTEQPSADVDEGLVIGTQPPAGTELVPGETVTLVVSSGPEDVTVPPVEGLSEGPATQALENAGFEVQVEDQPLDPDDPQDAARDGRVLDQSPNANTQAAPGSTVTITVGRLDPSG
ncbi:Stk1 family PASTA domain-containing Ser/Thr kinase [soil metagenome]